MEENEFFVLSFFDEKYRKSLSIMGSISGRDVDKDKRSNLTPVDYRGLTIYKEAKLTFICKKIYHADLVKKNIPQKEIKTYYQEEDPHTMYIGEIVEIIE